MINSNIIPDTRHSSRGLRNSFSASGRVLLSYRSARSPSLQLRFLALSAGLNPSTMQQLWNFSTARRDFFSASSASLQTRLPAVWILSPAILRGIYFQLGDVRYLRYAACRFKSFLLFSTFRKNKGTKKVRPKCGYTLILYVLNKVGRKSLPYLCVSFDLFALQFLLFL